MIAKGMVGKKLVGDNLQIASEAKRRKLENPNTINATLGTLVNEDNNFYTFKTVDKILRSLENDHIYNYSSTDGGEEFKNAVMNWVFREYLDEIITNFKYQVVATAGGTGAVSNAVFSSLDSNQTLILPNIHWGPYNNIALASNLNVEKFNMFDGNHFNINGFQELIYKVAEKEGKVTFILNDPCHNPTGYTLSDDELLSIIDIINSMENIPFSIIYDIAYFDYPVTRTNVREKFKLLTKLKNNVVIHIAFSCSKTFSIYGLRTGAQIILSKDQNIVEDFYNSSVYLSRTRWSNIPRAGIQLLIKLYNDKKLYAKFLQEQQKARNILTMRAKLFIEEAKTNDLKIYPYHGGFFITIACSDGKKLFEALKKDDIYVIPLQRAIRISISSLPIACINRLVSKVKEAKKIID
ncbi:MAG TPA: aminotransferase class I/II-fold pyridoxal phosphate-dependent enzyme [Acholeplasmataceae bacterium]|nr:aminotransferase class I/II-fold pyridoxal phosphate-dependent enzyme [Acholeplasmataceae bacterium]